MLLRQSSLEEAVDDITLLLNMPSSTIDHFPQDSNSLSSFDGGFPSGFTACNDTFDNSSSPLLSNTTLAPSLSGMINFTQPLPAMSSFEDLLDIAALDENPIVAPLPFEDVENGPKPIVITPEVDSFEGITTILAMEILNKDDA